MGTNEWRSESGVRIRLVAEDTFQVRLPLPIPALPFVNVYALKDGDEWALVDAGWPSEDAWEALDEALPLVGCTPDRVAAVWLTHLHPDHMGLAPRLLRTGAKVAASARGLEAHGSIFERLSRVDAVEWRRHGVPVDLVESLRDAPRWEKTHLPDSIFTLEDVDTVHLGDRTFRVVYTPGHAAAHVSLFEEGSRLLFAGDHLLPNTTPHIGLLPGEEGNPLRDYLESLGRVRRLPVSIVLPGHGEPFPDAEPRIAAAEAHHRARLADAFTVVSERSPMTTCEIAQSMTWSIPWEAQDPFSRMQAFSEALAHLVELEHRGRVRGADGQGWESCD